MLKNYLYNYIYNLEKYPGLVLLNSIENYEKFEESLYKAHKNNIAKLFSQKDFKNLGSYPEDFWLFGQKHVGGLLCLKHAKVILDLKLNDTKVYNSYGLVFCIPGDEILDTDYIENLDINYVLQKYDLLIAQTIDQFYLLNKIINNKSKVILCKDCKMEGTAGNKRLLKLTKIATCSIDSNPINFLHRINTPINDIKRYYLFHNKYHSFLGLCKRKLVLKKVRLTINNTITPIIRSAYKKLVSLFPIRKKTVVFRTFQQSYTCNPKYICNELLKKADNLEIVWIVNKSKVNLTTFPEKIKIIQQNSLAAWYYLTCAKVLVDNNVRKIENMPRKRTGQIYVQTWHGSLGIKKFGNVWSKRTKAYANSTTDIIISNSQFESNVYRESIWNKTKILKCGHPRNDLFFASNEVKEQIREKVYSSLNLDSKYSIILYAPTFRDQHLYGTSKQKKDISMLLNDFQKLIDSCNRKFGKEFVVVIKLHSHMIKNCGLDNVNKVIDASNYPDIQELMLVTDVAITDYSSWIYDYILLRRPGFIYATDTTDYLEQRELYFPIDSTPFPFSTNPVELIDSIKSFDYSKFNTSVSRFLKDADCCDNGRASQEVCNYILTQTN